MIYRTVIKEAAPLPHQKRNQFLILSANNKSEALGNVIHKEPGNSQ